MTGRTRRDVLLGGLAAALAPMPALAAGAYGIAPVEVADGVWMVEGARESFDRSNGGAICNIVMLETASGAVVIDTGSTARYGAELRAFADQRLGGVAAVANTHNHPDHWFGNQAFADRPILALPGTIAASAAGAEDYAASLYAILGGWISGTTPLPATREVAPGETVIGGRPLSLLALSGHSAADLALLDGRTGTLVAGDMLFLDRAPSFPDADLAAWRAGLDRIAAIRASGVIPGHGPLDRGGAALAETRAYLDAFEARLRAAADAGLTPLEAIAAGPAPGFERLGANPEEYRRSVLQRWRDFETAALPETGDA